MPVSFSSAAIVIGILLILVSPFLSRVPPRVRFGRYVKAWEGPGRVALWISYTVLGLVFIGFGAVGLVPVNLLRSLLGAILVPLLWVGGIIAVAARTLSHQLRKADVDDERRWERARKMREAARARGNARDTV